MGDQQNPAGGAGGSDGGAGTQGGDSSQSNQTQGNQNSKTVSWENHQRVLDDMHKFKKDLASANTKLGDMESERLKATNDYKSLFEAEQTKRAAAEKERDEISQWAVNTQRHTAVKAAAEKKGLRKEALPDLELLDMKSVKVEATSTGRFIVEGAEDFVNKTMTERPHWFGTVQPPIVNGGGNTGGGAGGGTGKLTPNDIVQAERDSKRGKITPEAYQKIHTEYCRQQKDLAKIPGTPPPR